MSTIKWDTVVSAAATAVLITLGVEYFAKPRLEARKERILDGLRARRELLAAVVNLSLAAEFILLEVPKDADPKIRDGFRLERQRHYSRLQDQSRQLFDNAGRYAAPYPSMLRDLVLAYLTCIHGTVLSPRTQHRQAEIITGLAVPIATVLERPRLWRLPAWVGAVAEVKRLILETEQPATREVDTAKKYSNRVQQPTAPNQTKTDHQESYDLASDPTQPSRQ